MIKKNKDTQNIMSGYKQFKESQKLKKEIAKLYIEFTNERNEIIKTPYAKRDATRLFELTHTIQEKEKLLDKMQHPEKYKTDTKQKERTQ